MSPKAGNIKVTRLFHFGLALSLAGLAAWIILLIFGGDAARVWRALLINFLYFTPLASGLVTWSAIVIVSRGYWAGEAERLAWSGFGFLAPSLLVLVVLWIGSPNWAPWYGKETSAGFWLDNTFLFIRDLAALVVFWANAAWYLRARSRGRDRAMIPGAVLIVIFCIAFSLIGYDLAMALDTSWSSAIFGAYFFISGLYNAVVFWALMTALRPGFERDVRSDFGKLIITFSVLSAYFFFMQLITIWYENLPHETSFVVARMNNPSWYTVSLTLIVVIYLAPVVLLLTAWAKQSRFWLGAVALLLLVGIWFQRWWLVMPGFLMQARLGAAEIASLAALLGLFWVGMDLVRNRLPEVPPDQERQP